MTRDHQEIIANSLARFGIALEDLSGFHFDTSRKKFLCIHSIDRDFDSNQFISTGIPFIRHRLTHPKLTTAAAMLIGHLATKNVVNLSALESIGFLKCELLQISESSLQYCDDKGFVIARCGNIQLGVGFFERDDEGLWLKGLFPSRWRKGNIMPFS